MRIAYDSPPTCGDRSAFLERVRSRTEHGQLDETDTLAWQLEVSIREVPSPHGTRFVGQVAFDDPEQRHALRRVDGSSCEQVVSSLALVVALAIDDRVAWLDARAVAATPADPPLPSPPSVAASEPPKKEVEPARARPVSAAAREPRPEAAASTLAWTVGGTVGALSWLGPEPALALGVFAELGEATSAATLRVSFVDSRQSPTLFGVASHFTGDFGRIEACPVSLVRSSRISLSPCLGLDAGVLRASVDPTAQLTSATSKTIFWGAVAAAMRLRWRPAWRLSLDLDGELAVPVVRHTFQLENPQRQLFEVPAIGVGTKIGVGLHFP